MNRGPGTFIAEKGKDWKIQSIKKHVTIGEMMETENLTTIRGIVLAAEWKKNGLISAVDIAGYDEKRYRVVSDEIGNQLRAWVKKRVVADGVVMAHRGKSAIRVHRFQVDTADPIKPTA